MRGRVLQRRLWLPWTRFQPSRAKMLTNWRELSKRDSGRSAADRADVRKCLGALVILPVEKHTLLAADAMAGNDFEDNILIAAAVNAAVDAIITRNVADFSQCPIPVWEPAELLRTLQAG